MKVTVIYGTMHKGSTYNCVKNLLNNTKINDSDITEFFLPKDMPHFCCSCFSCFLKGEDYCPHYKEVQPIAKALEEADLIVLSSPVYVLNVSGQMKALLDHLGYRWMPHRPYQEMFSKVGVVISTAAGAGTKEANKVMKKSLLFMGVRKVYSYGINVGAMSFEDVGTKKKEKIEKQLQKLGDKVIKSVKNSSKKGPSCFAKMLFYLMRMSQKNNKWNKTDYNYWKDNGWLDGKKPW
ncbi:flavodoxin family protein [Clostridium hydrogenum]|uniref:flavodoxin family protein n=1 Tax=Clostridium hydrogenum TaxID=2855764 RepID=UPI001F34B753|nr:flavodoxin family protein [Clostridium hydrogenum]